MAIRKKNFINRDISWLIFNQRVLQEAENIAVPLLERVRFLGIYANNLDEFCRVRLAMLQKYSNLHADNSLIYPDNPQKTLREAVRLIKKQHQQFSTLFKILLNELEKQGVKFTNESKLTPTQAEYVTDFYHSQLEHSLSPIFVSLAGRFPQLRDSCSYLLVRLSKGSAKEYALVEVPTSEFPRFIKLPSEEGVHELLMLDDAIRLCLPMLFSNLGFSTYEAYSIKICRDADIDFNQDIRSSMLDRVALGVKGRFGGTPVVLRYDKDMPRSMLDFITLRLGVASSTLILPSGRYQNLKDLMNIPFDGKEGWRYEKWDTIPISSFEESSSLLQVVSSKDSYLHCPYHCFSHYLRLLREASIDPDVKAIKTTVYRLASNSKIVKTLINAANNGKKVTVVVELLARFDEYANVSWAQRMQEAGIKVIFGVEGLKIHCKLTYIHRKDNENIVCIGTGNFHERNAGQYTDIFLLTAHKEIVKDVERVFKLIDHPYNSYPFKHLLVSPHHMRRKFYWLIRKEINNAKQGKEAYILCKMNQLTDKGIIKQLYEAASVGVKVSLVVRGSCSIVSTKNIEVVSVVDKFLEHSRIFIFANDGDESCYISSADWMTRNLDERIEVAAPVFDHAIKKDLKNIVLCGLKDNVKARIVDGSESNKLKQQGKGNFRSQWEVYKYHANLHENSEVENV